jgi:hypothetical protein
VSVTSSRLHRPSAEGVRWPSTCAATSDRAGSGNLDRAISGSSACRRRTAITSGVTSFDETFWLPYRPAYRPGSHPAWPLSSSRRPSTSGLRPSPTSGFLTCRGI